MKKSSISMFSLCAVTLFGLLLFPAWGASTMPESAVQSIRVGDIDIGYRIIGEGQPLVLITGYGATMDIWDPQLLQNLASQFKVVLFDNRGMGRSTASEKPFSIGLFAEDTIGLLNALKIKKAHVLGWSMGTFITQELALKYPDRLDKLVLYAATCGWQDKGTVPARPEVTAALMDTSGNDMQRTMRLMSILFPKNWMESHPDFLQALPRPSTPPSVQIVERQGKATGEWAGVCNRLHGITSPTLLITGFEDVVIPPDNSRYMASLIPNSWLIRLPGGHSTMYQYPKAFSRAVLTFLESKEE
jgi:pimeloyl-ACP methyl ester carboxylesterase